MRWDSSSGQYDMGFRNYAPGLNQFLSRDMYNGALADMQLSTDPFTGNRYTFAAGNPITNIELDGHSFPGGGGAAGCPYGTIGCLGYHDPPSSPTTSPTNNDTGPGGGYCTGIDYKLSACTSERGAAGTTPEQVKQSLIGAGIVLLGALPIGDAIGGLFGLFRGASTVAGDAANTAEDASLGARAARLAADCGGASFSPGTKVLLASGIAVPISQLKPGEKVLATDARTGKTRAEPVSAVLVHHDTNRYDLKVRVGHRPAVIHTTRSHLFWVPYLNKWVPAAALRYGTHLRTPGAGYVTVTGGHSAKMRSGWMWDLTITGDHDFYITAAHLAVLVHNCPTASGGSASGARFVVRPNGAVTDLNGPTSQIELNHAAGDAFRDTVAGFLRSLGREVVTDAEDKTGLTINTPLGPRVLDIAVADSEGNPLGYIETKWGSSPYGGDQLARDEWLRSQLGVRIDVVYGGGQ